MIKSFKCRESQRIFTRIGSRKLPVDIQKTALRKLTIIHAALSLNDLCVPPSNYLKQLKGNKKGKYSIRINNQWRICFEWRENNAYNIEIIDYH